MIASEFCPASRHFCNSTIKPVSKFHVNITTQPQKPDCEGGCPPAALTITHTSEIQQSNLPQHSTKGDAHGPQIRTCSLICRPGAGDIIKPQATPRNPRTNQKIFRSPRVGDRYLT